MRIDFGKIRWKNFLAAGNIFLEIDLRTYKTTIISGPNGSGKSTLLDALTFVLFGKAFRNINKPNLCNTINQKDCVVELEFVVGTKAYKVIRGIKPNIFEIYCDGKLVNQDAARDYQNDFEKFVLGMNFKSFTQIVVLGSNFIPFMQLKAIDKRNIIEDLLDIQIFSAMNVLLKQRLLEIKDSLIGTKHSQELIKLKIDNTQKLIEEIKNNTSAKVNKFKDEITQSQKRIYDILGKTSIEEKQIAQLQGLIQDEHRVRGKSKKYQDLEIKIETNFNKIKQELEFYEQNENCPTCLQDLETQFKAKKINESKARMSEMEKGLHDLAAGLVTANERMMEIQKITKEIVDHSSQLIRYNASVTEINKYITKVQAEIDSVNTDNTEFSAEQIRLDSLAEEEKDLLKAEEDLITDRHYYDVASGLLKDTGIKTKIIKQYLPVINKQINKYLSEMDFFVNFTLNESFEAEIKSRFRDEFAYENFSEGEKKRIDLSLLFTWRDVAKMKNSVNTNLIVFDEILDSSLDFKGMDILMSILDSFDDKTNIVVISHKGDVFGDKFKKTIKFQKRNDFSTIMEE